MSIETGLVPPRRLGWLLRQARLGHGLELTDLSREAGLSISELDDIEHGRRNLEGIPLDDLIATYGVKDAGLVPERSRLIIDLDGGQVSVEQSAYGLDPNGGPDAILARYLALVYRLRGMQIGTQVPLRDIDLEVLGSALNLIDSDVENRLHRLMKTETAVEQDQRRIRRQLLYPLVGILVAATGVGTLVLVARDEAPAPPQPDLEVSDGIPRLAPVPGVLDVPSAPDIGNATILEFPGS